MPLTKAFSITPNNSKAVEIYLLNIWAQINKEIAINKDDYIHIFGEKNRKLKSER